MQNIQCGQEIEVIEIIQLILVVIGKMECLNVSYKQKAAILNLTLNSPFLKNEKLFLIYSEHAGFCVI